MKELYVRFIIVASFSAITTDAFSQKTAAVTGSFETAPENSVVYIMSTKDSKDSAYIHNNHYSFSLHPDKTWDVYFIKCPGVSETYVFPLLLKAGSKIKFEINKELDQPKISGDEIAEEQNRFYQELTVKSKRYWIIKKAIAETKDSYLIFGLNDQLKKAEAQIELFYIEWVNQHRTSPFSVAVIRMFIMKPLQQEDTLAEKCYDTLLPQATENNYQAYILTRTLAIFNDKYSLIQTNTIAPDFSVRDVFGKEVTLQNFKNTYVLIDFWASWCGPCRANNPMLKTLYHKYKDRGLNVLSISVDTDAAKWKNAIKEDGMDWYQGSDLLGLEAGVATRFHIGFVPQYMLIAPDGKIILKSIGGDIEMIEAKVNEVLR